MSNNNFQTNLDKFIPACMTFCMLAISGDGVINALYILESRSVDGASLGDYFLAVGFFALWVGAIRALTMLGLEVLPQAPKDERARVLPLWVSGMVLTAVISVYMSSSFLGLGIAKQDYFSSKTQEINAQAAAIIEAQRTANSLQVIFQSSEGSAKVLYEMERKQGSVCEQGSGKGRCATALLNLIEVSASSRQQLIEQNGLADPIIAQIQELQDGIRRIANNSEQDYDTKTTMLQEKIALMAGEIEALSRTLPIATLLHASDSYARNWSAMGLGDVGSRRLTAEFRPVSDRLKREIGALKAATEVEIQGIRDMSEYELLAQSKEALPIIGIATLLSCLPMLLSLCVLGISGGNNAAEAMPSPAQNGNRRRTTDTATPKQDASDGVIPLHLTNATKH